MSIFILDSFLTQTDLEQYRSYIISQPFSQKVIHNPELTTDFWNTYGSVIQNLCPSCVNIYPSVTVTHTHTPIRRHVDVNHHGEQYKILIYLNDVPNGGTIFYLPDGHVQIIENQINRLVLFDMNLSHESQAFSGTKKIAIGFRVQTSA